MNKDFTELAIALMMHAKWLFCIVCIIASEMSKGEATACLYNIIWKYAKVPIYVGI